MNLEILNKIGLTPTEIKTYEALINLKQASPAEIAQETGLTRPNTYQLLSRLESLELVKKSPKTKKITYEICSPDRLVELFNEEVKKIDKTQADFKKLINEFMSKIDLSLSKPVIKYSDENQNSVKELFLEFLDGTTGRKIYSFLNRSDDGSFTEWMDTVFIPERIKRNIPLDSIITDTLAISIAVKFLSLCISNLIFQCRNILMFLRISRTCLFKTCFVKPTSCI